MSYIIAGLALLNGLALVAGVAGQQIMNDLRSVKSPKKSPKQNNQPAPVMVANASETEEVRQVNPTRPGVWVPKEIYDALKEDFPEYTYEDPKAGIVDPTKAARQNGKSR